MSDRKPWNKGLESLIDRSGISERLLDAAKTMGPISPATFVWPRKSGKTASTKGLAGMTADTVILDEVVEDITGLGDTFTWPKPLAASEFTKKETVTTISVDDLVATSQKLNNGKARSSLDEMLAKKAMSEIGKGVREREHEETRKVPVWFSPGPRLPSWDWHGVITSGTDAMDETKVKRKSSSWGWDDITTDVFEGLSDADLQAMPDATLCEVCEKNPVDIARTPPQRICDACAKEAAEEERAIQEEQESMPGFGDFA